MVKLISSGSRKCKCNWWSIFKIKKGNVVFINNKVKPGYNLDISIKYKSIIFLWKACRINQDLSISHSFKMMEIMK